MTDQPERISPRSRSTTLAAVRRLDPVSLRLFRPGAEIALFVDQGLLQDVPGVLAMLEFEAMGLVRVRVGLAAQYIDHNLVQAGHMNADEHMFLRRACRRSDCVDLAARG